VKILVTGFEPFGGSSLNPSEQVVRALAGQPAGGPRLSHGPHEGAEPVPRATVVTEILPVDRYRGPEALRSALERTQPDAVLCLGEASRRAALSIERVAINLMDYRIPDNSGQQVTDLPVVPGGPAAYFVTLPVRAMLAAVQGAGVPVELSLSAGSYLCNQVLYDLLHQLSGREPVLRAGFIHLPSLPEQASQAASPYPSMALETILKGVRAALAVLADGPQTK
jgi:pyroglutamyl-peptidase